MAEAAAGVDADRQAVRFGRLVDRPVLPPPERKLGHRQQQDLDEAVVGGEALDLLHREFGAVRRDDDRGAQPRIAIQPLGADPVVDGAAERGGQVLAQHDLRAVDDVADGVAGPQAVEQVGLHRRQAAAGRAGRPGASRGGR